MRQAAARGLAFHALVSEDGGRLGVGAVRFVNFLATHAGSSMGKRRAFVFFALQRLRCAAVKGLCALTNMRSPSGGGPSRSCRGLLLLPEPKERPAATRTRTVPGTHLGVPTVAHHEIPTPPPCSPRAAVPSVPALPGLDDNLGVRLAITRPMHRPPLQGLAAVPPAFPPRIHQGPGLHASQL